MAKLNIGTNMMKQRAYYLDKVDMARPTGPTSLHEFKFAEAQKVKSGGHSIWIDKEAEALGEDIGTIVERILEAHKKWEEETSKMEAHRVKAKRDIRQAASVQEMETILQTFLRLV